MLRLGGGNKESFEGVKYNRVEYKWIEFPETRNNKGYFYRDE